MKALVKSVLIKTLVVLCFSAHSIAQTAPQKWVFHGVLVDEKVKSCTNSPSAQYDSFWLPNDKQYQEAYKEKMDEFRAKHSGRMVRSKNIYVTVGTPKYIGLVAKKWKCGA